MSYIGTDERKFCLSYHPERIWLLGGGQSIAQPFPRVCSDRAEIVLTQLEWLRLLLLARKSLSRELSGRMARFVKKCDFVDGECTDLERELPKMSRKELRWSP